MKSFVRWSLTLGLMGTALVGSFVTENLKALALPEAQVMEKLQAVPVFTVTDPQGSPLVANVPNGQTNKNQAVAGVFISQQDAKAFVERLRKEKPDLAKNVQVVPVSLAQIYKLKQENQNKPDALEFMFVPTQQELQSAEAIKPPSGQQAQKFQGTPLFVATGASSQEFIVFPQGNGQQVVPFFFEKAQLQKIVDTIKQKQPNTTIQIQAVPLEGVIEKLRTSNDPFVAKIVLVRSSEADTFVQSLPSSPATNQPQR